MQEEPRALPLLLAGSCVQGECEARDVSPVSSAESAGSRSRQNRLVDDLPDLMNRIEELGLREEYQKFRDGYLAWRQGRPHGAQGEHTVEGLSQARTKFDLWYPSQNIWLWRKTLSYWISIFFLEGALLFTLACCFSCVPEFTGNLHEALTAWPMFAGGIFFTAGSYLMCIECANVLRKDTEWIVNPLAFRSILCHIDSKVEATRMPYYASISYFFGALIYGVGLTTALFGKVSLAIQISCSLTPNLVGGALFLTGGIFECVENQVFQCEPKCKLGWWAALANLIGGFNFLVGAVLLLPEAELLSNITYTVGSAFYVAGAVMSLLMWRDELYGLTFLPVVNQFSNQHAHKHATARFSFRGIVFLNVYCFVATLSLFNFCRELAFIFARPEQCLYLGSKALSELLPFLLLHMVLMFHSAVVQTPKAKPYHWLVIAMRWVFTLAGCNSALSFFVGVVARNPLN